MQRDAPRCFPRPSGGEREGEGPMGSLIYLYSPVHTLHLPLFVVLMLLLLLERESGRMFRVELAVPAAVADDGPVFRYEKRPTDVRLVVPHQHVPFKLEQTRRKTTNIRQINSDQFIILERRSCRSCCSDAIRNIFRSTFVRSFVRSRSFVLTMTASPQRTSLA